MRKSKEYMLFCPIFRKTLRFFISVFYTHQTFTFLRNELMTYLYQRGYNRHSSDKESHALRTRNEEILPQNIITTTMNKSECHPFTLTYNPLALRSISYIIRKHFLILTSSHRCHTMFKSGPIVVVYRRSNNLSSFLARDTLRNPSQNNRRPVGSVGWESD